MALAVPRLLRERDGLPRRRGVLGCRGGGADRGGVVGWREVPRDYYTAVDIQGRAAVGVSRAGIAAPVVPSWSVRLSRSGEVPYAELHCLTNFTFLRGASHPHEMVKQAVELGYEALADYG